MFSLQVLITHGVSMHQVPAAAFVEGLGRLISSIRQPKQDAPVAVPAATSAQAQQAAAVLTPQPISNTVMQQVEKLPVISAGMLQQQFRQLQALQQQGANSAGMPQQSAHPLFAANVAAAAGRAQAQRPAGIAPRAQPGQQQSRGAPHSSAPSAHRALPQQAAASAAQPEPPGLPARQASLPGSAKRQRPHNVQQQRLQMLAGTPQAPLAQPVVRSATRQMPVAPAPTPQQPAGLTGTQQTSKAAAGPAGDARALVLEAARERPEVRGVTMERFMRLEQQEQVQRVWATMQAKAARVSAQQEGSAGQQQAPPGPVPAQSTAMQASAGALQQLASSSSSAGAPDAAVLPLRVNCAPEQAACPAQDSRAPAFEVAKKRAEARGLATDRLLQLERQEQLQKLRGVATDRLLQLERQEQLQKLRVVLRAKAAQASAQQGSNAGQPRQLPSCMPVQPMATYITQQHRTTAGMAGAAAAPMDGNCASAQAPDSAQDSWSPMVGAAEKRAQARGVTLERLVQLEREEQVQRVRATMQANAAIAAAQQALGPSQASQASGQQQYGSMQAGQPRAPPMGCAPAPEQAPNAPAQQHTAGRRPMAGVAAAAAGVATQKPWQQSNDTSRREQPAAALGDLGHGSASTSGPESCSEGAGSAKAVGGTSRGLRAAQSDCPVGGPAAGMPGMAADVAVTVHLHLAGTRAADRSISIEKTQVRAKACLTNVNTICTSPCCRLKMPHMDTVHRVRLSRACDVSGIRLHCRRCGRPLQNVARLKMHLSAPTAP